MSAPRHIEMYGALVDALRFHRRFSAACAAFGFLALAVASYGIYVAAYRPLAFHVDASGEATFVGRLREQAAPTQGEVRYVAKTFLKHYQAFNSLTVESDFAEAINLMAAPLQQQTQREYKQYADEHHQTLVAFVKSQGIQTELEFDDKRSEVLDHNGKAYTAHLRGVARRFPLNRAGTDVPSSDLEFEAFITLVRCPRTEQTPNGLLVAKVANRFYADAKRDTNNTPDSQPVAPSPEAH